MVFAIIFRCGRIISLSSLLSYSHSHFRSVPSHLQLWVASPVVLTYFSLTWHPVSGSAYMPGWNGVLAQLNLVYGASA